MSSSLYAFLPADKVTEYVFWITEHGGTVCDIDLAEALVVRDRASQLDYQIAAQMMVRFNSDAEAILCRLTYPEHTHTLSVKDQSDALLAYAEERREKINPKQIAFYVGLFFQSVGMPAFLNHLPILGAVSFAIAAPLYIYSSDRFRAWFKQRWARA
jgi:hypothetical protein